MVNENEQDQWAPTLYDEKHSFVWRLGASVIELLAPQSGERILDVGCGTGQLTAQMAESGAKVVGIDNSLAMIDEARCLPLRRRERLCVSHRPNAGGHKGVQQGDGHAGSY